jgi:hypothetical protein
MYIYMYICMTLIGQGLNKWVITSGMLVEMNCARFVVRHYFLRVVPANTTGSRIPQKRRPNLNNSVRNSCIEHFMSSKRIPLKPFGADSTHLFRFLSNICFT